MYRIGPCFYTNEISEVDPTKNPNPFSGEYSGISIAKKNWKSGQKKTEKKSEILKKCKAFTIFLNKV